MPRDQASTRLSEVQRHHATVLRRPVARDGRVASSNAASSPRLLLITTLLAMTSISAFAVAQASDGFEASSVIWLVLQLAGTVVAVFWAWNWAQAGAAPYGMSAILVLFAVVQLIWEAGVRAFLDVGAPVEIVAMAVVRNLVIALAVASAWRSCQRLCVLLAVLLAIFAATACRHVATHSLAALDLIMAGIWLAVSHWENVRQRLHQRHSFVRTRLANWLLLPALALPVVALASVDRNVATTLSGWVASSGGDQGGDPFARHGVGEGDRLIAGTDRIQSFGPIEDAPFLQDDRPSLYDVFDDTYEEPIRSQDTDRAVALTPDAATLKAEHLHTRTERPDRSFSTRRESTQDSGERRAKDLLSDALFYVSGRTPLHLRLEVYDEFDGVSWRTEAEQADRPSLSLVHLEGKPWIKLPDHAYAHDYLAPAETHGLKIINLDTPVVPAPLHLHGVHIDLVDRLDMFRHGPDGLIAMDRERLPALVPIHVASRSVNERLLLREKFTISPQGVSHPYVELSDRIDSARWHDLAKDWAADSRPGWETISAITAKLHRDYVEDRTIPEAPADAIPVEHFLFESKRGPDYLFATATALLLRSLGYSTRVVSGFYVSPAKFERRSGHTPVHKEDVHFWAEVRTGGNNWIAIEPTPGYSLLGPPPRWADRAWSAVVTGGRWLMRSAPCGVVLSGVGFVLFRCRCRILDLIETWAWRCRPGRDASQVLLKMWRLFENRARRGGAPRKTSVTIRRWLRDLARNQAPERAHALAQLGAELEGLVYCVPEPATRCERDQMVARCRQILDQHPLKWFSSLKNVHASPDVPSRGKPPSVVPNFA